MTGTAYSEDDFLPEAYGLEVDDAETPYGNLLDAGQRLALTKLITGEDDEAKRQMISHNLNLVVNIARRYSDHGVALFDLIREGVRGFIHALENFEMKGGFRFSTYAARCVRRNIILALVNQKDTRRPIASSWLLELPFGETMACC